MFIFSPLYNHKLVSEFYYCTDFQFSEDNVIHDTVFSFMQKPRVINQKLGIYNLCIVRLPALISIERGGDGHWTWEGPNMSDLMHHTFNRCSLLYIMHENAGMSLCHRRIILFLLILWCKKEYIHKEGFEVLIPHTFGLKKLRLVKIEWLHFFWEIAISTQILEFNGKQITSAS